MKKATIKERDYINFLRGIAIFLMLWGHSIQFASMGQFDYFENVVFKVIYSFHMPLFMMISGYLFYYSASKRNFQELFEYKGKSLMYSILMGSVLNLLLSTGVYRGWYSYPGAISIGEIWFLWSVLSSSLCLAVAIKASRHPLMQSVLAIAVIWLLLIFPNWDLNLFMYPFFVAGYFFHRNKTVLEKMTNIAGIVGLLTFVAMIVFYQKKHFIYISGMLLRNGVGGGIVESIKVDLFRYTIGLFGSVAVIWISLQLYKLLPDINIAKRLMISLGTNSLAVYVLSLSIQSFWLPIIVKKALQFIPSLNWNDIIWFYALIIMPLISVAYSYLLLWIINVIRKIGIFQLFFGR